MSIEEDTYDIGALLSAIFPPHFIQWRAGATNGNRAMALAYIDARTVQDRLDAVCGVAGWKDDYEFLPNGAALCRLSIKIDGEWITKADVGGQSEQNDEGDRVKAAFSDALKRAAVKWGIGRYLYEFPTQWVDYDPQKKQLTGKPALPDFALPPKHDPKQNTLSDQEMQKLRSYEDKINSEVDDLDKMNAARVKWSEMPTGKLKDAAWQVLLAFARQQGWRNAAKRGRFVHGGEREAV